MSLSWRFDGGRFAGIANSMATIELANVVLGRVNVIDTTSLTSPRAGASANLTSSIQTSADPASGSGFTLTFVKASGSPQFTLDLVGTVDTTHESLLITPEITNDGPATDVIHAVAIQLKIKPIGESDACMVMLPGPQSQVYPWDQIGADNPFSHPGLLYKGDPDGANPSDEPSGELSITTSASFVQWVYLWNENSRHGFLLRCTDTIGQGKFLRVDRDAATNEILVTVFFVPPGNSVDCQSHAFSYGLELRPMYGEDWDALVYIAERQVAEGHPIASAGTLRDRVAVNDYAAWDIFAFFAMTVGNTVGFDYTRMSSMVSDILDFFDGDLDPSELLGTVYDVQDGLLGQYEPSVPYQTGAATAVNAINALGAIVGLYTIPISPAIWDGSLGLPPGLGINSNLALDRDGVAIEGGLAGYSNYISPDFLSDVNTDEMLDFNLAQHVTALGGANFGAAYLDAHNGTVPPPNDNSGLTANDRGVGSLTYYPKIRAMPAIMRKALTNAGVSNPIVYTEHPNEMTVGYFDLFFDNTIGPVTEAHGLALITAKCSQPTIMWSRYTRMTHFDGFGDGPDETNFAGYDVEDFATVAEIFASLESFKWHLGHIPSFLRYFLIYGASWYFKSGYSAEYASWGNFIRRLFFKQKELVRFIDTSQRMRETPSSAVRRMRRAIKANDATLMLVPENKCHSSVWWDEPTGKAWIKLSNYSQIGQNPTSVLYEDVLTAADYEFLTTTKRRCTLIVKDTGARVPLPMYDGGGSYQPKVMVNPGAGLIIEMVETMIYWVDQTNGSDSNDGLSSSSAFASMNKVATVWAEGDTIKVVGGSTYAISGTLTIPDGVTIEQADPGETDKPIISAGGGSFAVITIEDVSAILRSIWVAGAGGGNHGIAMIGAVDGTLFEGVVSLSNAGSGFHADATATGTVSMNSTGAALNGVMGYDINGALVVIGDGVLSQSNTGNGFGFSNTSSFTGSRVISFGDQGVGILFDGTGVHSIHDVQIQNVAGYLISITAACTVTAWRVTGDQSAARGFSVLGGTLNIRNSFLLIHEGAATGGGGLYVGASGTVTFLNMAIVNFSEDAIPNIYTATTASSITMLNLISVAEGANSIHVDGNASTATVDTNTYYPDGPSKFAASSFAFAGNFATWQAAASPVDANSQIANPLLRAPADGLANLSAVRLRAGSPCIGFGTNLQAFFRDSATGAIRPAAGAWDSGPFVASRSAGFAHQENFDMMEIVL